MVALPDDHRPRAPEDLHYATLYLRAPVKHEIQALLTLKQLVDTVPLTCSDPGVASVKLAWWRDEFDRLAAGQPRHPLTRWSSDHGQARYGTALVRYVEFWLGRWQNDARSLATLRHVLTEGAADLWACFAALTGDPNRSAAPLVELGVAQQLGWETLRSEAFRRAGCPTTPVGQRDADGFDRLVADVVADLDAALIPLSRAQRRRAYPLVCLARFVRTALATLDSPGRELAEGRPDLTPVRKLAIAWRTRYLG